MDDQKNKAAPPMESPDTPADTAIGARLRAAREAQGKTIADIAAQVKVPARLLDAIERGAIEELPIGPYAIGFTRNYAQAVGMDAFAASEEMRAITAARSEGTVSALSHYEPADASRVPSRALAYTAAALAGLLVIAYVVWKSLAFTPDATVPVTTTEPQTASIAPAITAAPSPQPVVPTITIPADAPLLISATDRAQFTLQDANGRGQFDLTLGAGEFYTVKPSQRSLFLRTGQPQSLRLVVGDRRLPPLGPSNTIVTGIGLDPAALSRLASSDPTAAAQP